MEIYDKQLLYFKIKFFIKKMKFNKFFEEKNYNELLKYLCNRKKIRIFKIFIHDLFYLLEKELVDSTYSFLILLFLQLNHYLLEIF